MKRRWLFWFLIFGFVWLAVSRLTEIQKLAETLAQGQWPWIITAALLQGLYYLILSGVYQAAFATVGVQSRLRDLLPVTFASIFVNVVAPSGGASGAALFVDDAARRGQSPTRAALGAVLALLADIGAFALILMVGMLFLLLQHDLKFYEVMGAIVLLGLIGGLVGLLLAGLWQPQRLHRLLAWIQETINRIGRRFRRPALLAADWSEKNALELTEAAQVMAARPARVGLTLAIALLGHLVDLATLCVLFLAFRQPISLGPLVAGYSMLILFLIVSPTPMGVGVVEGVTPFVLISLGVPAAAATVITLAFRGLSFWLPLLIGFVLLQRVKTFRAEMQVQARVWQVRLVAILTALMGLINLISTVTPSLSGRLAWLRQFSPIYVQRGGHLTAALAGFALLLLAHGLWRRKRTAWLMTLVILVISMFSHLVKGLDYEEAILAGGLALWLLSLRSHFQARSDLPSIRRGLLVLAGALLFTLTYGTVGFYLLDRHFSVNFSFPAALVQTVVMFAEFYDPGLEPLTGFGRYFAASIYLVGAATLGYALLALISPVILRQRASETERERAKTIIEAYGRSSLARMNLFEDKAYWFSPAGSVVAYTARGGAAVALGDPIGPVEDAAAAIAGFKAFCAHCGWGAAFYQTLPDYLGYYQAAGFGCLHFGNEAVVDLDSFTLAGSCNKTLRSTVNRLTRLGYRAEVHQPPLSDDLLEELREVSDAWLAMMHGREKHFTLGWFDDAYIRSGPVMAIHTPENTISAFANIVSEYQRNEPTIDLMRRRAEIENGTMDFLFISLLDWARAQGYASFNLGFSPLSGVGEAVSDPLLERTLHFIYRHINQFYNFKGLHEFKAKYHPCWAPRYFIFENPAGLLAAVTTLTRASSGDDFMWDYARALFPSVKDQWSKLSERLTPRTGIV
jgi:phosphatidylglycerol lysyltransferase